MPPKITREIALRYNRFNKARRKAGDPPIGDPLDVVGLKSDTLSREPKGNGYAKKGFAKPQRRRFYDDGVPLKDNKKIAERKQREQQQAKPAPKETKASPPNFAKGGKVKKTGMAKVHKGEVVLTAAQAKRMKELFN